MHESNGREPVDAESLTDEHRALIALLSEGDLSSIDAALLSRCDHHFRKVAYIVGSAMSQAPCRVSGLPDIFYAQRVRHLVSQGSLESAGNLAYMRYSEVRVATLRATGPQPNCVSKPTAGDMLLSTRLSLASGGLTRR
jgi:hypothetical protein